mmetsp:Transcript_10589/g.65164  ORF Transcript_10589/g.65164 Transcript_10589/m.65164 type:complete len:571 (-) Transcript_10589:10389-12101(-)
MHVPCLVLLLARAHAPPHRRWGLVANLRGGEGSRCRADRTDVDVQVRTRAVVHRHARVQALPVGSLGVRAVVAASAGFVERRRRGGGRPDASVGRGGGRALGRAPSPGAARRASRDAAVVDRRVGRGCAAHGRVRVGEARRRRCVLRRRSVQGHVGVGHVAWRIGHVARGRVGIPSTREGRRLHGRERGAHGCAARGTRGQGGRPRRRRIPAERRCGRTRVCVGTKRTGSSARGGGRAPRPIVRGRARFHPRHVDHRFGGRCDARVGSPPFVATAHVHVAVARGRFYGALGIPLLARGSASSAPLLRRESRRDGADVGSARTTCSVSNASEPRRFPRLGRRVVRDVGSHVASSRRPRSHLPYRVVRHPRGRLARGRMGRAFRDGVRGRRTPTTRVRGSTRPTTSPRLAVHRPPHPRGRGIRSDVIDVPPPFARRGGGGVGPIRSDPRIRGGGGVDASKIPSGERPKRMPPPLPFEGEGGRDSQGRATDGRFDAHVRVERQERSTTEGRKEREREGCGGRGGRANARRSETTREGWKEGGIRTSCPTSCWCVCWKNWTIRTSEGSPGRAEA